MTTSSAHVGRRHRTSVAAVTHRRNRLAVAVALSIALLPFGGTFVAGQSIASLALVVPAGLAVWLLVTDERPVPGSILLLGLALGIVSSLVAAAGGVNPESGFNRVIVGFVALGYATAIAMAYRPGLERDALDYLSLVSGAVSIKALTAAGSLEASVGGWVVDGRLTTPFAQPNELGIFCAMMLPVAVTCLVLARSRTRKTLLAVASAAIAAALLLSMSRGGWIGATVALTAVAAVLPSTRRLLAAVGASTAAACVLALVLPPTTPVLGLLGIRLRSLGDTGANEYDARPLIWGEAWRQISERPWLGVGPDGYRVAATDSVSTISSYGADHAHDIYLAVLVERGVVGLAAGAVVLAGASVALLRHFRRIRLAGPGAAPGSAYAVAVLAGLFAVLVHGVFDVPLRNPIVYGFVWTLLGMAVAAECAPAGQGNPDDSARGEE